MALITWTDEYSVGINLIDVQHKTLINMINHLNDAVLDGSANDIIDKIFDGLTVYSLVHFEYEEKLCEQNGYADTAAHKAEHDTFKMQITDLQKKMNDGDIMIGIEVMSLLEGWITDHILKTDMAYSEFLISKGVK